MFSTTSSSSFQQLASPRPLSPRPSLLYSSKVSFRCLRLQSNTPSRRRLETTVFGRDFPSFLSTSTVSFSSSRRLLARRSTPSSSTRPKCSPLPCSASRKSRQLYLPARPSSRSFARNRASLPKRRRKTPSRRTRRPRRPFSLVFSALSALSALCDCWSSTCSTRLVLSFSSFSQRGFARARRVARRPRPPRSAKGHQSASSSLVSSSFLSLSLSFAQSSFSFARALMCVLLIRRHRCSEYFRKVQKIHETKLDLICFYALDMFLPGLPLGFS